jgi:DNA-binding MarR family transcriptional regulator
LNHDPEPCTLLRVTARAPTEADLAADAWRNIFDFIVATVGYRNRVLAQLGLTPNDSRALATLDPHDGQTMRSLARAWDCDASTATWIVDRLEAKGLAERRPHATDRRVKLVVLTPAGIETRAAMQAGTYTPPPELVDLDREDLLALRDATAVLPALARRQPAAAQPNAGNRRPEVGR